MITATLKKAPAEEFAIGLKFVSPDLEAGETLIQPVVVTINPPGELLAIGTPVIDEDTVSQIVAGGLDGTDYDVTFRVVTSIGHIFEGAIFVMVRDTAG